jgi:hypothetical protein
MKPLLERPATMPFEQYKTEQKEQNKRMNFYIKHGGILLYKSWEFKLNILNTTILKKYPPSIAVRDGKHTNYKPQF